MLVDLTRILTPGLPVYPGDDTVKLYQIRNIPNDGYNNYCVEFGMHVGTHLDGPLHMFDGSPYISEIFIDRFLGNGVLIDVRGKSEINFEERFEQKISPGDIVLFLTGHGQIYRREEYFKNYPVLTESLADFLVKIKVNMVGLDTPSPDRFPFSIHKRFLKANILIIENLVNLEALLGTEKFEVYVFPLKIQADSAPVRVIAHVM